MRYTLYTALTVMRLKMQIVAAGGWYPPLQGQDLALKVLWAVSGV
ncbi:MAG: hypothetical protein RR873_07390 [Christensenella sp.]